MSSSQLITARPHATPLPTLRPSFTIVRGCSNILAHRDRLAKLAIRYEQPNVTAHLTHFVSAAYAHGKNPCLLLCCNESNIIDAAILLVEYTPFGLHSRVFVCSDFAGERDIIAHANHRPIIAKYAAEYLMSRGAALVLVALQNTDFSLLHHLRRPLPGIRYATSNRTLGRTLPLAATFDATLASLGAHTRRNLRAFRRRAEAQLKLTFHPKANLSEAEFLRLNRNSPYPARTAVARWRFRTARTLPGSFFAGLQAADGSWPALIGGRYADNSTFVDWQINTAKYPALSLGTVLRSFLIEHEIHRGAQTLTFEGGTTHTINRSFLPEQVGELLLVRPPLSPYLLRTLVARLLPRGNSLAQALLNSPFQWHQPVSLGDNKSSNESSK